MNMPHLLKYGNETTLSHQLFNDLQMNRILSEETIAVLRHPCETSEIARRNELFRLLEKSENMAHVENTLSVLCAAERALYLLKDAKIPLDIYYRQAELFESYLASCDTLISMQGFGALFTDVADYYSSEESRNLRSEIKESAHKIRNLLFEMSAGLLSFADKNWLTPDYDAVSEIDNISECAEHLGFTVPKKKAKNIKINLSLSDAICRLHADKTAAIEAEIAKYANVDFYEPVLYIHEIKFFLEIQNLIGKAKKIDTAHCVAKIADEPRYKAKELCDVSLLAKDCKSIISNDADFTEKEPFFFLIGANGGGKTTYLRALGVNLILFLAGCPVFAREAEIYPFDTVLSHFPKDERFDSTGRLDEEKIRTGEMMNIAQGKTAFLFFNETFSGTDDKRGFELLTETVVQIGKNRHFGLYVTHFHGVMSLDYPVLSAEIDPDNTNRRTFRIVRTKGNSSSYAADILKKYRLDKDSLAKRRAKNDR